MSDPCPFCGAVGRVRTVHHLVPRSHGGRDAGNVVDVGRPCHVRIHKFFTNDELADGLSTVSALRGALGVVYAGAQA
jgi:hypothetical protein